jgi:cytidylate kinase
MPIITIYQGASGSGQELAEAVAKELGYPCISREVLVEASRKYGIPQAKLKEIVEKGQPWLERLLQNLVPYRIALQAAFCELVQGKNVVYHGHIGHELVPNIKHVLKVLLTAPLEIRIEQVRKRLKLNHTAARRCVDEVDRARTRRIMAMFDTDWRDPSRYDLVLNLGNMTLEEATRMIVEAAKLPGYQPTVVSEERLQDLTLAMRVHATLVTSQELMGARLEVTADGDEVSVSGSLPYWVSDELIKRHALQVSGVDRVETDFTISPAELA